MPIIPLSRFFDDMKTRIVQTDFYRQMTDMKAPKDARLLYKYLFDNPYINMCGIYEIADAYIMLDTALTEKELENAKKWLSDNKRVFFCNSWIYVIRAEKHNNYKKSPKNKKAYEKELNLVPSKIRAYFEEKSKNLDTTPILVSTSVDTTQKSEIRNKKSETRNKKSKINNNNNFEDSKETLPEELPKEENSVVETKEKDVTVDRKEDLNALIKYFEKINPNYELIFKNRPQRDALQRQVDKFGYERIRNLLINLPEIMTHKYSPQITTPIVLEQKMANLINFLKRKEIDVKSKITIIPD